MHYFRSITLRIFLVVALVGVVGCNRPAATPSAPADHHGDQQQTQHEHGGHTDAAAKLIVSTEPIPPAAGQATKLHLMVHEASGKMLKEFAVSHEKLAHLIVVRRGLDEFAHLHPDVDTQGNLHEEYVFPTGGEYLLFLDYQPLRGSQTTVSTPLRVAGHERVAPPLVANVPGQVHLPNFQATVSLQQTTDETTAVFAISDDQGEPVRDLQPYLGAMGHLVVISADGKQFVHAHPLTEKPGTSEVKFLVHFPGPGLFKMWGQFQRQGKVFTIPAVVQVDTTTRPQSSSLEK